MEEKTRIVRDKLYFYGIWAALNDVSMYAYYKGCPGLSDVECEVLEGLADKACEGVVKYILETESDEQNCVKCKHYTETEDDTGVHSQCRARMESDTK